MNIDKNKFIKIKITGLITRRGIYHQQIDVLTAEVLKLNDTIKDLILSVETDYKWSKTKCPNPK